jgi:acetolactate synthase-1/2/3 large subunit
MRPLTGADQLAAALQDVGVTHVFGLPGTQNALLFSALARTAIRTVTAGSELTAAFMANGFFRAGGPVPVVAVIPGPGFTFALPGVAEAAHDSAAMILLTGQPARPPGKRFALQALDQAGMVRGLARATLALDHAPDSEAILRRAMAAATAAGPGPVLLEVDRDVLGAAAAGRGGVPDQTPPGAPPPLAGALAGNPEVAEVRARLLAARKLVVLAGQGAVDCPDLLAELLARRPGLVMTTASARGVIPESHPWSLAHDFLACSLVETNRLLAEADLVLALGFRASQNGTAGYGLRLPEARLVHVDRDPQVLGANYAARWPLHLDVRAFLEAVVPGLAPGPATTDWTPRDAAAWRSVLRQRNRTASPEPRFPVGSGGTAGEFFAALQSAWPADAILVTDTGNHQIMARCHLRVGSPRGLIVPTDFQSMGFGLPAAIGAALAAPGRRVVAIVGDGGMMMTGMELATAVGEGLDLAVVVLRDGHLGQIRDQQIRSSAGEAAVAVAGVDYEALAAATGAAYACLAPGEEGLLARASEHRGVVLVEVPLGESGAMRRARWRGAARSRARRALGPAGIRAIRRLLRRR